MAKRAIRVTGFTRFFLVMLIVAPLAYIGASYYNGEDGIEKLKKLFNRDRTEKAVDETPVAEPAKTVNQSPGETERGNGLAEENKRLQEELDYKSKRVDELYRDNEELKRKLESLEKTLKETKGQ